LKSTAAGERVAVSPIDELALCATRTKTLAALSRISTRSAGALLVVVLS
jgi:hypothetical protein